MALYWGLAALLVGEGVTDGDLERIQQHGFQIGPPVIKVCRKTRGQRFSSSLIMRVRTGIGGRLEAQRGWDAAALTGHRQFESRGWVHGLASRSADKELT